MIHLIRNPLQEVCHCLFSVEMYVISGLLGKAFTGNTFGNSCCRRVSSCLQLEHCNIIRSVCKEPWKCSETNTQLARFVSSVLGVSRVWRKIWWWSSCWYVVHSVRYSSLWGGLVEGRAVCSLPTRAVPVGTVLLALLMRLLVEIVQWWWTRLLWHWTLHLVIPSLTSQVLV